MKKNNNLFIIDTPLHLLISQVIAIHFNIKPFLFCTEENLKTLPFFDHTLWKEIFSVNSYKRINLLRLLLGKLEIPDSHFQNIFIFNDFRAFNQILLKSLDYSNLIYIDDGFTAGDYNLRKSGFKKNKGLKGLTKKMAKKFLGLQPTSHLLLHERINEVYLFYPHLIENFRCEVKDLGKIISSHSDYVEHLSQKISLPPELPREPDYLILTQPLTRDGITKKYEERKVVDLFLDAIPTKSTVIIKPHPFDTSYFHNIKRREGIYVLESLKFIPYELLHARIRPKRLVSFWSTALLTAPLFYSTHPISLASNLKTTDASFYVNYLKTAIPEIDFFKL